MSAGDRGEPFGRHRHRRRGRLRREVEPGGGQGRVEVVGDLVVGARLDDHRDVGVGPAPDQAVALRQMARTARKSEQDGQQDRQRIAAGDRLEDARARRSSPASARGSATPTMPGTTMTPISMISRMTSRARSPAAGEETGTPEVGDDEPAHMTSQMTDPKVIPAAGSGARPGPDRRGACSPSRARSSGPCSRTRTERDERCEDRHGGSISLGSLRSCRPGAARALRRRRG